jgi:hypothetical protein
VIATKALRRKVDYQLLRWQARLDGEWADRVIPIVAAAGLFVVLAALALARARTLDSGIELARWVQGAWMLTNGRSPEITVAGPHLFEPQGAVGFAALAQLTRLAAPIPLLITVQSAALSLGVIPIWRICRKVCSLRAGAAAAAVLAYGAYPPMHQLNLADFHPEALAVPLLLGVAYAGFRRHWWWALGLAGLALTLRSDLGLTVAAIGMVTMFETRGRQAWRLVGLGLGWSLLSLLVLQPAFGDGSFVHADAFARYGSTFHGVIWGMLSDPLAVVGDLLERDNFAALVALGAPVAFLPVLTPRHLLPVAPVVFLAFIAEVPLGGAAGVANVVPAMVFVFIALPFALARLGRRNIERITVDRRMLGALTFAAFVFFVHDAPASPYERPWNWGGRSLADQARVEAVSLVDESARVRSSVPTLAELASREHVVLAVDGRAVGGRAFTDGVDAVLLDQSFTSGWNTARADGVRRAIQNEGFELTLDRDGVWLFLREPASDGSDG